MDLEKVLRQFLGVYRAQISSHRSFSGGLSVKLFDLVEKKVQYEKNLRKQALRFMLQHFFETKIHSVRYFLGLYCARVFS